MAEIPSNMSMPDIATFALVALIVELTPGPNMVWLAIVAATSGRRAGYAAVAGVALGLALVGAAAALGLAALIGTSGALYQMLRWAGVAYLFWLAWDGWRDSDGQADGAGDTGLATAFRRGLVTNLLNPKAAAFYLTVLPDFLPNGAAPLQPTLILTGVYVAVATLIHAGIVTAAGAARRLLESPAHERWVRRALSVALGLVALWFLWKTAA